jgi:hypothetical protein
MTISTTVSSSRSPTKNMRIADISVLCTSVKDTDTTITARRRPATVPRTRP